MANINGIEGMSVEEVNQEIAKGGKFVIFLYCFSVFIMTFKRSSDIYFIRADEGTLTKSLPFSALSFFVGWWGIPWGIIYTIQSLITNFSGGQDITGQVISALRQPQ